MACTNTDVTQLVIGDDYLAANSRAFTVTFCAIDGFNVATCEAKIGFNDNKGNTLSATGGSVVDNGDGTWTAEIELSKAANASVVPGRYDWSIEIVDDSVEVTVAKSVSYETQVQWVVKQL